jgi:hypothetical protein
LRRAELERADLCGVADAAVMLSRGRRRTLRFGLETVLGLRRSGFFIPHRYAAAADRWRSEPYAELLPRFEAARPAFAGMLAQIDTFEPALVAICGLTPPEPRFEQDWFPRLDAAMLYAHIRAGRPARIIEVGSGHSTRFAARAIRDGELATTLTAIDPAPRADLGALPLTLLRAPLQEVDLGVFGALRAGDLLVIDSSHVLMPGTDVDILLNRVLPRLPVDTSVFIHDIFLPDPYPPAWPFTSYNEQTAVAPLLQGGYEPIFASAYVVAHMPDAFARSSAARLPLTAGARESGLLLRKSAAAAPPGSQALP